MLPSSHLVPINASGNDSVRPETQLADAFAAFNSTAGRLEHWYRDLQAEVVRLRQELEARNAALACSLAENERMRVSLRRILDHLPCGVIVLEVPGDRIVLINPEARRLLSLGQDDDPHLGEVPARVRELIHTEYKKDGESRSQECEFVAGASGGKRWLAVRHCQLEIGESGKLAARPEQRIVILRDVTARKTAELEREASRNIVALAEVTTVLAHEIRNPLCSLELFAQLLATHGGLASEPREWVEQIQAGIRALSATVNNVLHFHTLTSLELQEVKLAAVLQSGIDFIRPVAAQAGVALDFHNALGDTAIVGDPHSLQQVLLNLAMNAFRHTPAGGKLTVSASLQARAMGQAASIEFTDTGCGISPEHLPHIFEPGFSGAGQRPGLGLPVCQRIVQQHGGVIQVESRVGKGTTFRLEFPVL